MKHKPLHLVWAIVCLLLGACLGFATARLAYATLRALVVCGWSAVTPEWSWLVASVFPVSFLAIYFIWVAKNSFARAAGRQVPKASIGWGRLVSGFFLIFYVAYTHFVFGPRTLADDPEQAAGRVLGRTLIVGIGITLMCWALIRKTPKREPPAETLVR